MKHKVQFISLEEDDKDLIVSFAIDDPEMGVKSPYGANIRTNRMILISENIADNLFVQ